MAFYVGQKVVCVDAGRCYMGRKTTLVKDAVYTVAAVLPPCGSGVVGLLLVETRSLFSDGGYRATRFRPVVEDADKLEWARQLVAPKAKDRELAS
jgi:hypothetical protein